MMKAMRINNLDGISPLILALDTDDLGRAKKLAQEVREFVDVVKVGLQLFSAVGTDAVRELAKNGFKVFLDLKLNDIPNTVAKACRALCNLEPFMLTVHAMGGQEMMRIASTAVQEHCEESGLARPMMIGVTVLTSLDLLAIKKIGINGSVEEEVLKLAKLANQSGLDGLVTSPLETLSVRREVGEDMVLVTPGIRLPSEESGDQARAAGPSYAIRSGADFVVVGRPITQARDPRSAAREIIEDTGFSRNER